MRVVNGGAENNGDDYQHYQCIECRETTGKLAVFQPAYEDHLLELCRRCLLDAVRKLDEGVKK